MYSKDDIYVIIGNIESYLHFELDSILSQSLINKLKHGVYDMTKKSIEYIQTDQSSGYSEWYTETYCKESEEG